MSRLLAFRRVGFTFTAQIYNQIVIVAVQLLQVPFLLSAWGADRYGGWLVLYAVPSYLTLSDFGFTLVAKNSMVMHAASSDHAGVLRVYHSVFALLLVAAAVIIAACGLGIEAVTLTQAFALGPLTETAAKLTILFLVGSVVVNQFLLLLCAGVRAAGRPAAEVTWGASSRLLEGVATVGVALLTTRIELAALAVLVMRVACTLALWIWLRSTAPDIPLGLKAARLAEIRRMANPSFSYMLLGLAQALAIQGPIVLLGAVATAQETVLFSTSRTLARMGTSAANLVNYSFAPEYSRLHGQGNTSAFARLKRIHVAIGIAGILAYCLGLWALGPYVMELWTHGHVAVVYPFFALLNAAVAAEMWWGCLFTPIAAINRHVRLSYLFVGLTAVCAVLAYGWALSAGATGIAAALLLLHGGMSVLVLVFGR